MICVFGKILQRHFWAYLTKQKLFQILFYDFRNFFSWFLVFFVGFGCSLPVLGVLSPFWVFPAGFGCFRPVFGVLCQFWVFSAGFLCSRLVLSVLSEPIPSPTIFGAIQRPVGPVLRP